MSVDLSGYTFTNGTKVSDWIASLPADDRMRAYKVVEDFVAERKPLNMLQVKIRLATPAAESDPDLDIDKKETAPEVKQVKETIATPVRDAYSTPGPIRPTVDSSISDTSPERKRKLTPNKLILITVAIIMAVAVFTNPSRETHVRMLTESVARATAGYIGQDAEMDMFGEMFGFGQPRFTDDVIESLVYDVLNQQLEYHNYILFSTCSAHVGYDEQTVSVGAFGMVRATEDDLTVN